MEQCVDTKCRMTLALIPVLELLARTRCAKMGVPLATHSLMLACMQFRHMRANQTGAYDH